MIERVGEDGLTPEDLLLLGAEQPPIALPAWLVDVQVAALSVPEGPDDAHEIISAKLPAGDAGVALKPWSGEHFGEEEKKAWDEAILPSLRTNAEEQATDVLELTRELYRHEVPDLLDALGVIQPEDEVVGDDEIPTVNLAAFSGLVFEASVADWPPPAAPIPGLELRVAQPPPGVVPVHIDQRDDGFHFTFLDAQGGRRDDTATWSAIELERWRGPVPAGTPALSRLGKFNHNLPNDEAHVLDGLRPTELVGEQLSWRLRVIDEHGQGYLEASGAARRERLDVPPPPAEATVAWTAGEARSRVTAALPPKEVAGALGLAVFVQRRALDPCGYYGDSDDLALLEGMRALDFDASGPEAWKDETWAAVQALGTPTAGDKSAEAEEADRKTLEAWYVKWKAFLEEAMTWDERWARLGLVPVGAQEVYAEGGEVSIEADALAKDCGLRFFVCAQRTPTKGRPIYSAPVPCRHVLELAGVGGRSEQVTVAQLERVALAPPQPGAAFLRATIEAPEGRARAQIFGEVVHPAVAAPAADKPEVGKPASTVRLRWRHPAPEELRERLEPAPPEPTHVGGYRVWTRDPVGKGDPEPWRLAAEVRALSATLAALRPHPRFAEAQWRVLEGEGAHAEAGASLDVPLLVTERFVPESMTPRGAPSADVDHSVPADDISALLAQLEAKARLRRYRAPLDLLDRLKAHAKALSGKPELAGGRCLVTLEDPEGVPYSELLLLALPPKPASGADAFEKLRFRHVALRETLGRHRTLAWDDQRRVTLTLEGPSDDWHHDLEYAIEVRDRYAELRDRLQTRGEPELLPGARRAVGEVPERAVLPVEVLRRKPVLERVAVLPEPAPQDDWVAFRLLPPPAWHLAHHNAVNDARLGHLRIEVDKAFSWPEAARYQELLAASAAWLKRELPGAEPNWQDDLRREISRGKRRGTYVHNAPAASEDTMARLLLPLPTSSPSEEPSVRDRDIVEIDRHTPFFQQVHLAARLAADTLVGEPSQASARRGPRQLGLLRWPAWDVLRDETTYFRFELPVPVLAAHLDAAEVEALAGSPSPTLDGLLGGTTTPIFGGVPIERLPDLELELSVFIDVGPAGLKVFHRLFTWRGPAWRGADPAAPVTDPLPGFGYEVDAGTLTPGLKVSSTTLPEPASVMLGFKLEIDRSGLEADVARVVDEMLSSSGTNRLWGELRRGAKRTRRFQLRRENSDAADPVDDPTKDRS